MDAVNLSQDAGQLPQASSGISSIYSEHPSGGGPQQLFQRPIRKNAALFQQQYPVAALRLVHVGGSHNHGQALRPEAVEHGPEMAPGQGVDAEPRFVKDQQLRFMDQIGT